jgi:hypothetical protein
MKLATILVPLDGSPLAAAALPTAVDFAKASGARLLLLRAAEAPAIPRTDPSEAQVEVVREAEAYLDAVKRRLETEGVRDVEMSVWYAGGELDRRGGRHARRELDRDEHARPRGAGAPGARQRRRVGATSDPGADPPRAGRCRTGPVAHREGLGRLSARRPHDGDGSWTSVRHAA